MNPLKRCPFCGSSRVEIRLYNQPSAVCLDCLCMGPAAHRLTKNPNNLEQCLEEAAIRWNHRVDFSHPVTLEANQPIEEPSWRNAALRIGEDFSHIGPEGYYSFSPSQWLDWALKHCPKPPTPS